MPDFNNLDLEFATFGSLVAHSPYEVAIVDNEGTATTDYGVAISKHGKSEACRGGGIAIALDGNAFIGTGGIGIATGKIGVATGKVDAKDFCIGVGNEVLVLENSLAIGKTLNLGKCSIGTTHNYKEGVIYLKDGSIGVSKHPVSITGRGNVITGIGSCDSTINLDGAGNVAVVGCGTQGNRSKAVTGRGGRSIGGESSHTISEMFGVSVSSSHSRVESGFDGASIAGGHSTASTGVRGIAFVGKESTARGDDLATVVAGTNSEAITGKKGVAISLHKAIAGEFGVAFTRPPPKHQAGIIKPCESVVGRAGVAIALDGKAEGEWGAIAVSSLFLSSPLAEATTENLGVSYVGPGGKAAAGKGGILLFQVLSQVQGTEHIEIVVGRVGYYGIDPDVFYKIDPGTKEIIKA